MRQAARFGLGAWLALVTAGPSAAAMFYSETRCTGALVFPNADGSSEQYEVTLALVQDLYAITMTNTQTGASTTDEGTCAEYIGGICHHYVVENGQETDDFYAFGLTRRGLGRFLYEEVWRDGSKASTVLVCGAR